MVRAAGKHIPANPCQNLIPDSAGLVAKGNWTWDGDLKRVAEEMSMLQAMSMETKTPEMTLGGLEKTVETLTVPLLWITIVETALSKQSVMVLLMATDVGTIEQRLNWQYLPQLTVALIALETETMQSSKLPLEM
jgi:hypothetical protein